MMVPCLRHWACSSRYSPFARCKRSVILVARLLALTIPSPMRAASTRPAITFWGASGSATRSTPVIIPVTITITAECCNLRIECFELG